MKAIPNLLTGTRVAVALVILVAPHSQLRLSLVLWAAASDFLDGYLARRLGAVSHFGSAFDLAADGAFFLSAFLAVWRTGDLPGLWLVLILAASLPELVAQAVLASRPRRPTGSLGRYWNKVLGGYSYVCVLAISAGFSAVPFAALQVAMELWANGMDLWVTVRPARLGRQP